MNDYFWNIVDVFGSLIEKQTYVYLNSPIYRTDNGNKSEILKYAREAAFNFTRILISRI